MLSKKSIGMILLILSIIIVVSASSTIIDDHGDYQEYTDDHGAVYSINATPQRQDNLAYITIKINTTNNVNKSFTIQDNDKKTNLSLKDNTSSVVNTGNFTILSNSLNKSLNITDNENNKTVNLSIGFKNESIIPFDASLYSIHYVNNSTDNSIQDAINDASPGDTILLDEGVYNQHDIQVNKTNLTIKSNGTGEPIINAIGGRGFFVNESNIVFNGLTIINGNDDGGAIYITGNNGSVTDCSFINTSSINDSDISGGGAIYITGNNGKVSNSTFTNTSALNGGAIYISGDDNNVSNSTFTNTNSNDSGGAIYIGKSGSVSNSTFTNTNSRISGGAIYINGNVTDCTFINTSCNYTFSGDGGAIYIIGRGNIVSNSTFTNTNSNKDGGAIHIGKSGNVSNSTFINTNSRISGGAIYALSGSVSNSTFNNINSTGGAVNIGRGGSVSNSTFNNIMGGAVTIIAGSISNSTFNNTRSGSDSGAITINGDGSSIVSNSIFTNTSSGNLGGAISTTSNSILTVNNSNFTNSSSGINGGGAIHSEKGSVLNVSNSNFISCRAINSTSTKIINHNGGAISTIGSGSVTGSNFIDCTAIDYGGAIYGGKGSDIIINFNRFVNNNGTGNGIVIANRSANCSNNWWGDNTPDTINNTIMDNYYQVQLQAGNNTTTSNTNYIYNGSEPLNIGYKLVLNGTNNTDNVSNLPYFNANITDPNLLRSSRGMLLLADFITHDARDNWSSEINTTGHVFQALVDNEDISINIKAADDDDNDSGYWWWSQRFNSVLSNHLQNTGFPLIIYLLIVSGFTILEEKIRMI
jgi:hypothetical protein